MKKTILIIEDELSLRQPLGIKLKESGFEVIEAENGKEGLEQSLVQHPDLILLDILMSQMDGLAMLRALRQDSWGKTANVIVLTNLDSLEKVSEAAEFDAKEYIVKSDIKLEEIVEKIKTRLK